MNDENKLSIPDLSDKDLQDLLKYIHPVVRRQGKLYYIDACDPKRVAFTWDPKLLDEAKNLKKLVEIRTLHKYGYYGMFKPSIYEVLAQIPQELIGNTDAFEVNGPEYAQDFHKDEFCSKAFDDGFHVSETVLYTKV